MRGRTARTEPGSDDEPGALADRQRAGAGEQVEGDRAAIVAGIPIATRCSTRPSATPVPVVDPERRRAMATPQPRTPASSAVPQPRRIPSSRSDTAVMTMASTTPRTTPTSTPATTPTTTARLLIRRSVHRAARRRRRATSPDCRSTSSTSSARGWKARAASSATIADALASPSNSKRYVTQAPSERYVRVARSVGRQLLGPLEPPRCPARRSAPRSAPSTVTGVRAGAA